MEASGIVPTMDINHGYGDGYGFGGSGIWLFAILALFFFGGANRFGYGNDGRSATVEDLNNSANFTRLESQVQSNGQAISQGFTNLGNGISQLGYQLATDFGALGKEMSECCCGINRNIDALRYEGALNTASINANTTSQTQRILDALTSDKVERQAQRIQQLELQQALCGVVRYPTTYSYNAGPSPFCGGLCNGNI